MGMEEIQVADGILKPGDIFYLVFYTWRDLPKIERVRYTGGICKQDGHSYINIEYVDQEFNENDPDDRLMTMSVLDERAFIDKRKADMFARLTR